MRVLVFGGSGAIGRRLVPLLVAAGHDVAATTRSRADLVRSLGAEPVVWDASELERLPDVVGGCDVVVNQLTDLSQWDYAANNRIREVAGPAIVAAAPGARHVAQSIVFYERTPETARAVLALERAVLDAGGVVLRYGWLYGPGTGNDEPPGEPGVHVDVAAAAALAALSSEPGLYEVVDGPETRRSPLGVRTNTDHA
jgi:nucleoside-diphosphate-sugar epimerase